MTDRCPKCDKEVEVGEWPFCPHGFPERAGGAAMIDDQLPGGPRMLENLGSTPVLISSKSQLRDECRARGIRPAVRHVGVPGTDKSKETQRWI